jgi:hypothetical protein
MAANPDHRAKQLAELSECLNTMSSVAAAGAPPGPTCLTSSPELSEELLRRGAGPGSLGTDAGGALREFPGDLPSRKK